MQAAMFSWKAAFQRPSLPRHAMQGNGMTQRLGLVLSALLATGLAAQAAPHGWKHYTDAMLGYTIAYPPGWSIDTHYVSAALGPDR